MEKILFVDDDENILNAYHRKLRKQFQIETALGSETGLKLISAGGSFAVVISDLRMPGMDGIEMLAKIRQLAPDTVRIMLTGNADLQAAVDAVNQGNIFRFLTKPCSPEELAQAMRAGLEQHRLITAEKELLDQTLKGSIGVLTEILSFLDPQSFGRSCALRDGVREIVKAMHIADTWDIELAAMLSEIGRVTVPASIIMRETSGEQLADVEKDMLIRVPEIGHNLLVKIPRLEPVARMVLYQNKHFDGSGFPEDGVAGADIPLGARIIKAVKDFNQLVITGARRETALESLESREGGYDHRVLDCARKYLDIPNVDQQPVRKLIRSVSVHELEVGQKLLSNVLTGHGALLITAGNWISESSLVRIQNFARVQSIKEPIEVEIIESQ